MSVSQHEMKAHRDSRNLKRHPCAPRAKAAPMEVWTSEEVKWLGGLCQVYWNGKFINKKLEPHFSGKANKPIGEKRGQLAAESPDTSLHVSVENEVNENVSTVEQLINESQKSQVAGPSGLRKIKRG
ncbi:hypothetical protein QAD02_018224 [Eretmocerus hayati]|uniref:Uncharacterized protein n=1 Tax=Eretmocerus hayati TaxID=131215 RepID=A0ACC2PGG0_9HYME|nr:hypothetical protein QAD02_018224 [Eretmocerus hayati]